MIGEKRAWGDGEGPGMGRWGRARNWAAAAGLRVPPCGAGARDGAGNGNGARDGAGNNSTERSPVGGGRVAAVPRAGCSGHPLLASDEVLTSGL